MTVEGQEASLAERLQSCPEDHAFQIEKTSRSSGELCVELSSQSWWDSGKEEIAFAFSFGMVHEASFRLENPNFLRGDLIVSNSHPMLWDYGPRSTIFGNSALPDPPRFFLEFYRLIKADFGLERDPTSYLNWNHSFSEWFEFVASRSYRLLGAPAMIAEAAAELLDHQAAEYAILPDQDSEVNERVQYVQLGRSWVVCESSSLLELETERSGC